MVLVEALQKPIPEPEEKNGPAEKAGIFLPGTERTLPHMPLELGSSVLLGAVPPLTESLDPITETRRISDAQKKFGEIAVRATPGGPTQIFTNESSHDDFAEKEDQRIRKEIEQLYHSGEEAGV